MLHFAFCNKKCEKMYFFSGQHWILLFLDKSTTVFFDSFGQKPSFYSEKLPAFLKSISPNPVKTGFRIQHQDSRLCGVYCLYFAHHLGKNFTFEEILEKFSPSDFKGNDFQVQTWFRSTPFCQSGLRSACLTFAEFLANRNNGRM